MTSSAPSSASCATCSIQASFSSASSELRALTQALLQQLRADYEAAAALCRKMGKQSCKELRKAKRVCLPGLSVAELATLASLASVLPALETLFLTESSDTPSGSVLPALENLHLYVPAAGPDGVHRLVEGMGAAALPSLTLLNLSGMHVNDAGALALSAALGRGAMPRLKMLSLGNAAIGDAELVVLIEELADGASTRFSTLKGAARDALGRALDLETYARLCDRLVGAYGDEAYVDLVVALYPALLAPLGYALQSTTLDGAKIADHLFGATSRVLDVFEGSLPLARKLRVLDDELRGALGAVLGLASSSTNMRPTRAEALHSFWG